MSFLLDDRSHCCPFCKYRTSTSSNLKRHIGIHQDIRNFQCDLCNTTFRQKIHLERHIRYRHEVFKDLVWRNTRHRGFIPYLSKLNHMKNGRCGMTVHETIKYNLDGVFTFGSFFRWIICMKQLLLIFHFWFFMPSTFSRLWNIF